jgi:ABC-type nitrate/sulfonate/bicarbonate transport system substrate-binding protein
MTLMNTKADANKNTAGRMLAGLRRFWLYLNQGPEQAHDRAYLCSVAPLSAGALRDNEEAEHVHAPW